MQSLNFRKSREFQFFRFILSTLLGAAISVAVPTVQAADDKNNTIYWAGCGITKKAFMAELASAYEARSNIKIVLEGGGATRGIRDTVNLRIDLGGTCRMSLPETDYSELHATLHPVAWDALAIITHKENPIDNYTMEQLKAIYTGKIKNWKTLGGPDEPVHLYVREGNISGVGYAIRQYIFQDGSIEFDTNYVVKSSGPLEKAIEKDRYAIGITGVSSARKRDVKIAGLDGKVPSYENVRNGSYGLYRPLYLVTGPSPTKKVQDFINFATSEEGEQIIRDNGTVPYSDGLALMRKMLIYGFGVK